MPSPEPVEVVVPLRWDGDQDDAYEAAVEEMGSYLAELAGLADVTVVDGSRQPGFDRHAQAWSRFARHIRPDPHVLPPGTDGLNGKVLGAMTGVLRSRHEYVVLADDDVRYDDHTLRQVARLLDRGDLVRPANVFESWPWHARWDGSRSLLNRAMAADWPGTFGVRRSTLLRTGGWDPDVMFENLELVRTVQAHGGLVVEAPSVLVPRTPPTAAHFRSQRVRQAYDDLAQPWRLAWALATVPATLMGLRLRPALVLLAAAALVALAELGRRRAGARTHVPPSVPLFAPLWVLERGVCSWLAVWAWARGGVPYQGRRMRVAAHSRRSIRRRGGAAGYALGSTSQASRTSLSVT
ncbi:MAG: glycosyltransferase [Actinomycetes bacterium]